MAKITTSIASHAPEVLSALADKVALGLKAIGAEAETYAKKECPVDTGRLRNSIAWATSTDNDGGEDSQPKATPEKNAVYIGTNVEYGVYVEYGDQKHKTGKKHFLKDAATNHGAHYKQIMEAALKS